MMIDTIFKPTLDWIKDDFKTKPRRFCTEVLAWALSIGCSVVMASTVPSPPLHILYPFWISGCLLYAYCAYDRKSVGMLANYCLLVTIDSIALIRMWIN
jgi:hypothetical protein